MSTTNPTRPKTTAPLDPITRAVVTALLTELGARELARRWGVGAGTLAKAARGGSLTPAVGGWIATRASRPGPVNTHPPARTPGRAHAA